MLGLRCAVLLLRDTGLERTMLVGRELAENLVDPAELVDETVRERGGVSPSSVESRDAAPRGGEVDEVDVTDPLCGVRDRRHFDFPTAPRAP